MWTLPAFPAAGRAGAACGLALASLSACVTPAPDDAPGCHGPRRPANPHGSVLAPLADPATPTPFAAAPEAGCARRRG